MDTGLALLVTISFPSDESLGDYRMSLRDKCAGTRFV